MSVIIKKVVAGFHDALDGGLFIPSLPEDLFENFELWVKKNYPEIYENRAENSEKLGELEELEAYLVDENEGPAPIVKYVKTIDTKYLPEIFRSLRTRIKEFYSNSGDLDPQIEHQKAAIETLMLIDNYLDNASAS